MLCSSQCYALLNAMLYSMLCSTQCCALLNAIIMLYSKGGFELTNDLRNEYPKNMQFTKTGNEQILRV